MVPTKLPWFVSFWKGLLGVSQTCSWKGRNMYKVTMLGEANASPINNSIITLSCGLALDQN